MSTFLENEQAKHCEALERLNTKRRSRCTVQHVIMFTLVCCDHSVYCVLFVTAGQCQ